MKRHFASITTIILTGVLAGLVLIWLYNGSLTQLKQEVFRVSHLPIATVGGAFISLGEIDQRAALASAANQSRAKIFDAVIRERAEAILAAKNHVIAPPAEIQEEFNALARETSGGDVNRFSQVISNNFTMDPAMFQEKLVAPQVLDAHLRIWFNNQPNLNVNVYQKIALLKAALARGDSFADLAKTYSDDEATKVFGGDTGNVDLARLLPELKNSLATAKAGDSIYITSRYGQHVIKVLERDGDKFHLQTIFIRQTGYDDWLTRELKTVSVHIFAILN